MNEVMIAKWEFVGGKLTIDATGEEIERMVEHDLRRVADKDDGWTILYRNSKDGTHWELSFPHSGMHGGGPKQLREVGADELLREWSMS